MILHISSCLEKRSCKRFQESEQRRWTFANNGTAAGCFLLGSKQQGITPSDLCSPLYVPVFISTCTSSACLTMSNSAFVGITLMNTYLTRPLIFGCNWESSFQKWKVLNLCCRVSKWEKSVNSENIFEIKLVSFCFYFAPALNSF